MGKKKKLSLTIDEDVIKAAKKKAVDVDTSVSAEVERYLKEWAKDPLPDKSGYQVGTTTEPHEGIEREEG